MLKGICAEELPWSGVKYVIYWPSDKLDFFNEFK